MIRADFRLGELLTRAGLLPRTQLDATLERQAGTTASSARSFGRMLLEASIVDSTTLEAAIRRQRGARVKLGDALLEMGAITQDVLQAFLKRQRRLLAALSAGMAAAAEAHGLPARG